MQRCSGPASRASQLRYRRSYAAVQGTALPAAHVAACTVSSAQQRTACSVASSMQAGAVLGPLAQADGLPAAVMCEPVTQLPLVLLQIRTHC